MCICACACAHAAELIFKLLQVNPEKRLGTGPQVCVRAYVCVCACICVCV
jgi:hypothetical protein